ncbi:MAG TPA: APC family permease [Bryobacteraceae bacterium]|nr:APC family permease [Bryobacteraceae bacterium]
MTAPATSPGQLRRVLGLWQLVMCGIVMVQPTAPMPLFGVVSVEARGHVVTAVLIGLVAMLFTALSYGRMSQVYPSAGSAYTYVGKTLHPALGYVAGWSMIADYVLNPVICTVWCSKAAMNFVPQIPFPAWAIFFALLFTMLNLRGIQQSARTNTVVAVGLGVVIVVFLLAAARYILGVPDVSWSRPFYDPETFSWAVVSTGTSLAVLTYIGFDGISTLSEEVREPERNVLRGTVLTCLIIGVLSAIQVYAGQLVWPEWGQFPDVDTAFVHIAGRAGGAALFATINFALLVATVGSGIGAQIAAARLLFGMARDGALPAPLAAVSPQTGIPRNNILLTGATTLIGALLLSYQTGAELLNFGAFIGFMGVNAAAFVHGWLRNPNRTWTYGVPPALGFIICAWIWWSLRTPAKLAGAAWLAVGIAYGLWNWRRSQK